MRFYLLGFLATILTSLSGCSSVIHKPFSIDGTPAKSISLDARQRTVLVTDKGGENGDKHIVCAEPSPDTAAVLAAAFGANVSAGVKSGGISASRAESLAQLGQRTQTIQLLRDVLYRACESYMNGAINKRDYGLIVRAMDEFTITLLALDGLTQRTASPAAFIGANAESATELKPSQNEETSGSGSTSSSAESSNPTNQSSSLAATAVKPETAKEVTAILRSYYCFQINLKKMYLLESALENGKSRKAQELMKVWNEAGLKCSLGAESARS